MPSQPQASVEEPTAWRDASPRAVLALGAVVGAATMLVCAAVVSGLYAHGYAAGWQDGRYGTGHTVVLDGPFAPGQDFGGPAPAPQPLPWQVSPSDPQFDPGTPEYGFGGAGQGHFVPQR